MGFSNRKLYLFTLISNISRIVILTSVGMLLVPIHIGYWEPELYSIWLVINSVLAYLTVSNLGMNSAAATLINKTSNVNEKIQILKKSFLLVSIGVLILLLILICMNTFIDNWIKIIGDITVKNVTEAQKSCFILAIFFLINIPFSLMTSVINGFHKVYVENFIQSAGAILSIFVLLLNIRISGGLITFSYLIGLSNFLINIIRLLYFWFFLYKSNNSNYTKENGNIEHSFNEIFHLGIRFFIGSIASLIVLNTDNFVISHFLGFDFVTPYALSFKLFSILFNIIYVLNSSIIPLIGREISVNNILKVNILYQRTFYIVIWLGGIIWVGSFLFFKSFILLWSGERGFAGHSVIFALGAYSYFFSLSNLNNIIINTMNYVKGAIWIFILEAIINLSFSIILLRYWGLTGIAIGTFLGVLLGPTLFFPIIILNKSNKNIRPNIYFIIKHISLLIPFLIFSFFLLEIESRFSINVVQTLAVLVIYSIFTFVIFPKEIKKDYLDIIRRKKIGWRIAK